jgi:hypothetical protein
LTEIIARGPQGRVDTWVEPAFREVLRENGTFFRGAKCGEYGIFREAKNGTFSRSEKWRKIVFFALRNASKNGALLLAKMAKNGAFQKKFERNKSAINGTFETKNRLPQSDAATRPDSHVLAPYQT